MYNFKVLLRNINYVPYCNVVFQNVKKKLYKLLKLVLKKLEIYVKIIINYLKIKMKNICQLFLKHQNFEKEFNTLLTSKYFKDLTSIMIIQDIWLSKKNPIVKRK